MLSNFVGKTRRQTTLLSRAEPVVTPAQTTPSRRGSVDVRTSQESTTTTHTSPYANSQLGSSSQSSLASTRDKKRPLLQRALSKASLSSQDPPPVAESRPKVPSPFRRSTLPPKDDTIKSSKAREESVVAMEENARRLEEELSTTQKRLADANDQCTSLQERVQTLEKENQEREAQIKSVEASANEERTKLILTHGAELEKKRQELQEHFNSLESLKRESGEKEGKLDKLMREVQDLEGQVRARDGEIQKLRAMEDSLTDALRKSENAVYERGRGIQDLEHKNVQLVDTNDRLQKLATELKAKLKEQQPDENGFMSVLWKWFSGRQ